MTVEFNHTIVGSSDPERGARFLSEVLGVAEPHTFGPFQMVLLANGTELAYMRTDDPVVPHHYAFLVSEPEFDEILGRVQNRGLEHWADSGRNRPGEVNHNDGGRGTYFFDPDGHFMEILTVPYGGWHD